MLNIKDPIFNMNIGSLILNVKDPILNAGLLWRVGNEHS